MICCAIIAFFLYFVFIFYISRHTWASIAKSCGIAVEVISEALGHASITTTEGYLKQFDNDEIEKANKVIINYIFKK